MSAVDPRPPGPHPAGTRLLALLDGELDVREAESVRLHSDSCEACRRALDELVAVRALLASQPPPEPIRPVWPAIRGHVRTPERPLLRPGFTLATAATMAAGVYFGVLVGLSGDRRPLRDGEYLWSVIMSDNDRGTVDAIPGIYPSSTAEEGSDVR